jgi:hypothetical protein
LMSGYVHYHHHIIVGNLLLHDKPRLTDPTINAIFAMVLTLFNLY